MLHFIFLILGYLNRPSLPMLIGRVFGFINLVDLENYF
jgi:hypothetical protein